MAGPACKPIYLILILVSQESVVTKIFKYFLLFALGMVVAQDIWQRILTAKTIKIARAGTVAAGLYSLFMDLQLQLSECVRLLLCLI